MIELELDRPANDGASVGRDADGRVVFAEGGLPGEFVSVELHSTKKSFAKGRVVEVHKASPDRRSPECPTHARGCGGCDLAHASSSAQSAIKRHVVRDSLLRIARLDSAAVDRALDAGSGAEHSPIPARYRTTVRVAIDGDRAGYRKRGSHDVVKPDTCLVVHEQLEGLLRNVRFTTNAGTEAVLRVSDHSGEAIVLVDGDPGGVIAGDAKVVRRGGADVGAIIEHAGGREWRVSAESFFQAGPHVATALVEAVAAACGDLSDLNVVDAYAGIGLFAGTVAMPARSVIAIEQSVSSSGDARFNLRDQTASVVTESVESWTASQADVVIADPARAGLGRKGVDALAACSADRFVLVACDTGSLGRDVNLLTAAGFKLESVQVVDAFHDTSHVETVVALRR